MRIFGPLSRLGRGEIQALLAGGIVIGIGAVSTLASWNDAEFYGNTFTGDAHFNLQSSVDRGATWSDHATALSAGSLPFGDSVDEMAAGETVYAPVMFRLSDDSTWSADVTMRRESASGPVAYYQYQVRVIDEGATCDAAALAAAADPEDVLVPHDSGLGTTVPDGAGFSVYRPYRGARTVTLCFAVTRDGDPAAIANTAETPASVTWSFSAVPNE